MRRGPLLPALCVAAPEYCDAERWSQLIAENEVLLTENEVLLTKLGRVSSAIQGLVSDLASSRRESRRKQLEIDSLRAENASLAVAAPATASESVAAGVRR